MYDCCALCVLVRSDQLLGRRYQGLQRELHDSGVLTKSIPLSWPHSSPRTHIWLKHLVRISPCTNSPCPQPLLLLMYCTENQLRSRCQIRVLVLGRNLGHRGSQGTQHGRTARQAVQARARQHGNVRQYTTTSTKSLSPWDAFRRLLIQVEPAKRFCC